MAAINPAANNPDAPNARFRVVEIDVVEPGDIEDEDYLAHLCQAQRQVLQTSFREGIRNIKNAATNDNEDNTCVRDEQQPYVLVVVNSNGVRKFNFVMMKSNLYIVAIEYRRKWYELKDNDNAGVGRKFTCDLCHLSMRYKRKTDQANVCPAKFFEAINYFGKSADLRRANFDRLTETQELFELLCWYFAESTRALPTLDDIIGGFALDRNRWNLYRGKSPIALHFKSNWGHLSDGIRARNVAANEHVAGTEDARAKVTVLSLPKAK